MIAKTVWTNDEEASVFCFMLPTVSCRLHLYNLGDGEAEIRIEEWYGVRSVAGLNDQKQRKVISKMIKFVEKLRKHLQKQGFSKVHLIAIAESETAEFINSTNVVQLDYSEYMLQKEIEADRTEEAETAAPEEEQLPEVTLSYCAENDGFSYKGYLEEDANTPVFVAHLSPYHDSWYLYAVEVAEEFRGRGIGKAAMIKLLKLLQTQLLQTQIYLQVGSYNKAALHLYQELGFHVETEICYYRV